MPSVMLSNNNYKKAFKKLQYLLAFKKYFT